MKCLKCDEEVKSLPQSDIAVIDTFKDDKPAIQERVLIFLTCEHCKAEMFTSTPTVNFHLV